MLNSLRAIFSVGPFVPHGHCYLWKTGLVGLHITADTLIALAYYSIPIALFYFVRQRQDLPFKWIFLLFGAFIISCGTTHLLEIWTLWYPTYWLSGGIKAITALISVFTAIELIPLVPKLLALPNPAELQRLNVELQLSEARFSGILDIASDAIISIDAHQRITLFNQAAEKVFGYTANEALGQPLDLLLPQRFIAPHHQHISNFKERNGSTRRMGERSEIFARRKDGTEFPAEASISKLEVAGEKIFTAFLRDITDRKQAETKLQEQQQFLRQVIDINPNLIFVKDWEGKFTLVNQAVAEIYGTTIEDLIDKTDADFSLNPSEAEAYVQADRQVMQTLQPLLSIEETVTTSAGTVRCFQSTKQPIVSADGQARYVLGVATDITTLKQTEAALQRKTEELEAFFSSTIDLLCIANTEGYFLRLNPEWEGTLGYSLPELEGRQFLDFVHPEDLEATLTAIAQLSEQQPILSFTNRYRHQDGSYLWLEWRSVPKGNYIYAAARDITKRKQAEAELRLSQERLQLALEASNEGLWDWQIDTGEVYRSCRYLEILGYENEELPETVRSWEESIHPNDRDRVFNDLNAHLQNRSVQFACEYRMQTQSGEWKWIADYGKVVTRNQQGQPLRMIGTHKDVTDRKQMEQALRDSEIRFRTLIEDLQVGVVVHGTQAEILLCNSKALDLLGLTEVQLLGKTSFDPDWNVIHEDGSPFPGQAHPSVQAIMTGRSVRNVIMGVNRPQQNDRVWLLVDAEPRLDENGNVQQVICTFSDISDRQAALRERERAEAELKTQQAFLRQVIDVVPNNIFVKDREGRLLVVNQASATIHGTTTEAMIGKRETDFNPNFSDQQLEEFLSINQQVIQTRQPHVDLSQAIMSSTGETHWYQTVISPLINMDGEVTGIIGATTNVTALKQAEQALQQAKEAAEAANRAKSIFLANMSHELRTPLNVILGFAQVMYRDPTLNSEQRENLQIIRRSGDHLLRLINDVLDLSKIEAGHITLDANSVDFIDLLRSLEQMFRQRAEAKGLHLRLELASTLPQYVTIDVNKLRQVLINLLGNAIKFTQRGEVALQVRTIEPVGDRSSALTQSFISFEVSDTGIGIDPGELETIFSAFVQTQDGKISPDGTGLGLTISHQFVQLMGGDIAVQSTPGQGSTFAFTLPVHLAQSANTSMIASNYQIVGLAPNQPIYRILVVDDQPENRKLLVKLLTQIGLEVREAANGQEAVSQWQHWQPHLIYMDIRMPLLNGYEATQQIRANPDGQTPIIIALTAQASRSDRTLALASGCNDYLSKPFQEEVLFSKMAEHLGLEYLCMVEQTNTSDPMLDAAAMVLHPSDLSGMPSHWIAALRQAAQLCDDSRVENLIEQIPAERTSLIKGLRQLVQTYSFKQIGALTTAGTTNDNA
ncbi:PAS domain S-box protein [Leptolyngbya ohadii]|uniref:PAS domain S-box protein n=1 Tax=Leptolyngbya ohadii TaxID=1962290 RepID=UPI0015C5F151|nr:PAS domain S-box protein [Leptolyngbya ohadii]